MLARNKIPAKSSWEHEFLRVSFTLFVKLLFTPSTSHFDGCIRESLDTTGHSVSMLTKARRDRHPIFEFRFIPEPRNGFGPIISAFVVPNINGRRTQPGHRRHPRGIAQRCRTIRLLEEHSPRGEPVNIGSFCLRMPSEATHPIVQIIDCDEKDVRPIDRGVCKNLFEANDRENKDSDRQFGFDLNRIRFHFASVKILG